jgi:segregation and condensation protein B
MVEENLFGSNELTVREIIEALFFATDEPLTPKHVLDIFNTLEDGQKPRKINEEIILSTVQDLNEEYQRAGRAFRIVRVAGGYQFATLPQFAVWLGKMLKEKSKRKLSVSALESLAVIAYKQPVTKPEIEAIRGVNADYVMHTLLERNLISIIGRAATPGRPLLYGTTKEFLKHFGINDLSELPKPREIDELMAETEFEVEKRMLAELEAKSAGDGRGEVQERNMIVSEDGRLHEVGKDTPPHVGDTPGNQE